ncbi:MAG: monofunctional biosynthetic peptidoglycan transglycosylase [Acidobacteria bacterium]|nr:monofunctional biosynthetic peptidoglycan transglycosylase [Acidobacteriota bacterium]
MLKKVLIALGAILGVFLLWQLITFSRVGKLATTNPETTAFMEQRKEELRDAGKSDELDYRFVPWDRISPNLRAAVIVSEDSRFYEHEGLDTEELEKVAREAWEKKSLGRGGSTITQQLAKNLYLSPSRSPWRKLKELLIAKQLERKLSKKRILELYLNVVEMGERVYGAEAAAWHYFGVPASSLSPSQAALLAASLPNPRKMNPGNPGPYLQSRRDIIVSRMQRWGYIADRRVESEAEIEESETTESADDVTPEESMLPDVETSGEEPAVETEEQPVEEQPPVEEDEPVEPLEPAEPLPPEGEENPEEPPDDKAMRM